MFDMYESCLQLTDALKGELPGETKEKMLQFCAWAAMKGIDSSDLYANREIFIQDICASGGDVVQCILNLDDEKEKADLMRLMLIGKEVWDRLDSFPSQPDIHPDLLTDMLELVQKPFILHRLIAIDPEDTPLYVHVSNFAPQMIKMHFINGLGIFLCVGKAVDLSTYDAFTTDDLLAIFKALSDSSRLSMVRELLSSPLTSSQLAERVGITLSTVNHHMKVLMDVGLVSLAITEITRKGAAYSANRDVMKEVLGYLDTNLHSRSA